MCPLCRSKVIKILKEMDNEEGKACKEAKEAGDEFNFNHHGSASAVIRRIIKKLST